MSYATPDQLADALEIRVTPDNQQTLQDCLDAATTEMDRILTDALLVTPLDTPTTGLLARVNVNRAVEWWKAPAAYNGGVGTVDIGVMTSPTTGFGRHAAILYTLTATGASGVA
jgi:hypothetical protein